MKLTFDTEVEDKGAVPNVPYETKFENGSDITPYMAGAVAEGFCEGENATLTNQYKAWSYLCGTRIGFSLQGFYGRTINDLISNGVLALDGKVDWDRVDEIGNI